MLRKGAGNISPHSLPSLWSLWVWTSDTDILVVLRAAYPPVPYLLSDGSAFAG